ncbi:hypothetical protein F511_42620 [Dorcoceras hygrometricum]|uniref:Dystroglycan-like n=1 Tax=Dorcoceras hygrometricum TaxID=472368 RepID=A0A2Z7AA18_9LAMI|nr:hypothetical protein F511_42620 [Dorcoceras hygrometricum]
MASSFYSNTQHINFASVLAMNDPGMVSMFQALIASGLEGLLGCTAVVYETALVDFFENASVHDGVIISTVAGQLVEISEEWFAEKFELPMDGLADVSEIPKDKIFDAKSIVSMSGEPVILSGLKIQMKIHYRLLCDIMAKSISVKAWSFNAITFEKFSLMTTVVCSVKMNWGRVLFGILKKMVTSGTKQAKGFAIQISLLLENVPNLELGESSEFPSSKILTEKTVHRYIAVIDKSGAQDADVAPKATKTPKKRIVAVPTDVPVVKWKRTTKKKDSSSKDNLELMAVAQEAVPIQMIEGEASAGVPTVEQPAVEEGISADQPVEVGVEDVAAEIYASADRDKPADTNEESQWFDLTHEELIAKWAAERIITSHADIDEEIEAEKQVFKSVEAVESVIEVEEAAADKDFLVVDDPDTVINQVLDQLDSISADKDDKSGPRAETWFDRALDEMLRNDEGAETMDFGTAGGDQQVQLSDEEPVEKSVYEFIGYDEARSLEDIISSIPVDVPLPSAEWKFPRLCSARPLYSRSQGRGLVQGQVS